MDYSCDSNALILPPKTKNPKDNINSQTISCQNKKLSKSQKRKLNKLKEEKEKQLLLTKSLETLEKYKISDDAYSLLQCSEKIGQAETMREKRRRVMQFSKAGLDVQASDTSTKKRKVDSNECEIDASTSSLSEVVEGNVNFDPVFIEGENINTSTYDVSSQGLEEQNKVSDIRAIESNGLSTKVCAKNSCKLNNVDDGISTPSSNSDEKVVATMVESNGESKVDTHVTRNVGGDAVANSQIATTIVHVSRPKDVEDGRRDLPIIMMEQEIMETINDHNSVIISGETGCGKTTQIPQFLYEAGYGSGICSMKGGIIGITQPRRVAVLSTAKRVAYELGVRLGKEVGFQVRHDKKIGDNCSIKFMTDGILLRELQSDILLKRYSVIILDEAHERTLNTDILIGMLSRVVKLRQATYEDQQKKLFSRKEDIPPNSRIYPLKLILMSATLRVEDFTSGSRIFDKPPPVINIPARQFPVKTHFAKKTVLKDYVNEAYKKVIKIHKKLPLGGILVFVTGQREVEDLCRMLHRASKKFGNRKNEVNPENGKKTLNGSGPLDGYSMKEIDEALESSIEPQMGRFSHDESDHDDQDDHDDGCSSSSSELDNESEIESDFEDVEEEKTSKLEDVNLDSLKLAFEALTEKTGQTSESDGKEKNSATGYVCLPQPCSTNRNDRKTGKGEKTIPVVGPMRVLPLYAMLPASAQLHVFEKTKEGERLVVVATNVAETSLTIPGIKYVVDTGREKVKEYNPSNGIESYKIQWISKASASQRAGRAGRTGPGHCYCLYSSAALSNQFEEFSCPEILKIPVDDVMLVMKSMGISKVTNFPFPTPPNSTELVKAEKRLVSLEALDDKGRLTPLGKTMARYPMSSRHSRLLLLAIKITKMEINVRHNLVLGYAIAIAAALSSSNPFLFQFDRTHTDSSSIDRDENPSFLEKQDKLMKKKIKESSKISRAKFSNMKSDALTVAYALQCFEQSKNPSQFCQENMLHLKIMLEMSKLRKQLLQLVFNQRYSGLDEEFSWTYGTIKDVECSWSSFSDKNALSEKEEDILCQAICAGWADRVAKRIRGASHLLSEEDKKVNAIRYQACSVNEIVFLRHRSSVSKSAPDFLVYNEMLQTKRPYIQGATNVKSEWLVKHARSLCSYSAPLSDPKPFYDHHHDKVFCYVIPYFGPHLWELPLSKMPILDVQERVTVFAYALLDGQVLPCLKDAKRFMASQPSIILKPEALGQKRVGNLLSKLTRPRIIDSCLTLKEAWEEDPEILKLEVMDWFQGGFRHEFEELWEKMHVEALLEPEDRFPAKSRTRKVSLKH